jgi:hypothetical protein
LYRTYGVIWMYQSDAEQVCCNTLTEILTNVKTNTTATPSSVERCRVSGCMCYSLLFAHIYLVDIMQLTLFFYFYFCGICICQWIQKAPTAVQQVITDVHVHPFHLNYVTPIHGHAVPLMLIMGIIAYVRFAVLAQFVAIVVSMDQLFSQLIVLVFIM